MKKKFCSSSVIFTFILICIVFNTTSHGQLPAEIWHKVASFLPGNDPALRWFLEFLILTDAQADSWIKKYHQDTMGKNPVTFFGHHPAIEQAWLRFNQRRKAIKQALITNDRDFIEQYLKTEYTQLINNCIQATPEQLVAFKKDIYYALTYLERYYYMAKNQTTKTVPLHVLKALQQLVGVLSFTIFGFTFIVTLIEYSKTKNTVQEAYFLKCLNGTTAYNEGSHAYNKKHTTCKRYAEQLITHYNYLPIVSVAVILLLLNGALLLYIRSISLKHRVTQDIKYLIMSYYNQLRAYKKCIEDLTSNVSH